MPFHNLTCDWFRLEKLSKFILANSLPDETNVIAMSHVSSIAVNCFHSVSILQSKISRVSRFSAGNGGHLFHKTKKRTSHNWPKSKKQLYSHYHFVLPDLVCSFPCLFTKVFRRKCFHIFFSFCIILNL